MATYEETSPSNVVTSSDVSLSLQADYTQDASAASDYFYRAYTDFSDLVAVDAVVAMQMALTLDMNSEFRAEDAISVMTRQLLEASAAGQDEIVTAMATMLHDAVLAEAQHLTSAQAVALIANLIVAHDMAVNASNITVDDVVSAAVVVAQYVKTVERIVAEAVAQDGATYGAIVLGTYADAAAISDGIDSRLTAINLIAEAVTLVVHVTIGGERYIGWAMNAATTAMSEYSMPEINSMAQHGDDYLAAGPDGIYKMTGAKDFDEVFPVYLKTGMLDFGSDEIKRVSKAYLAYNASGHVRMKVVAVLGGKVTEYWYRLTNHAGQSTDVGKIPVAQGLSGRYWQFELVSDADSVQFDVVSIMPIKLNRRV